MASPPLTFAQNPHIIQVCAAVIGQYSAQIGQLRSYLDSQARGNDQLRLENQALRGTISQLHNDIQQLRSRIFDYERDAQQASVWNRTQQQIIDAQRQLVASLEHDLAEARSDTPTQTSTSTQTESNYAPAVEQPYSELGLEPVKEAAEGNRWEESGES
ncbi:Ankyrin repeat-containing domain protein [Purpureocillium lavendulum]|uniref:Ankyrin repeat-containing domain protein n=1 Tax=Purpureocillium lavendulum TaxID=1247861 RepID=A0AB34FKG6_9HYPO|nr:Ankyrin repeat-containing domain protein [Purpureocillium lavendulum]